jgi:hypothetical protein
MANSIVHIVERRFLIRNPSMTLGPDGHPFGGQLLKEPSHMNATLEDWNVNASNVIVTWGMSF